MVKNKLISFILQNLEELREMTEIAKETEAVSVRMYELAMRKTESLRSMYEALATNDLTGFADEETNVEQECADEEHTEEWQEAVAQLSAEEEEERRIEEEIRREEEEKRMEQERLRREEEEKRRREEIERREEELRRQEEELKRIEAERLRIAAEQRVAQAIHTQNTINDRFRTNVRHFGEEKNVEGKFVSDLKSAISTNDLIRFSRAFCGGERGLFQMAVAKMNNMQSFEEAQRYIDEELRWDCSKGAGADFIKIVENRFAEK